MNLALQQLKKKLEEIKARGFVKTRGRHDMGVGKTLEYLLGIKENNLRIPDLGEIELKAKRLASESMLTLATKSPSPRGVNRVLFERYKYKDADGSYNLHSTVYGSRVNPQGFSLQLTDRELALLNKYGIQVWWPLAFFDDVLRSKSDKILLVLATSRGKGSREQFHFIEAYLLDTLHIDKLKNAIRNGKLKVDIRIGSYRSGKNKGRYHDHGTAFRIAKRDFLEIYQKYTKLI